MIDVEAAFAEAFNGDLMSIPVSGRRQAADAIFEWLSFTAEKKPVSDLADRLTAWRKRIDVLAENVQLSYAKGSLVVNATGDADTTLRLLERGSDWFLPYDGVREKLAAALLG